MKLTAIQTTNFLGARSVDVTLTKPVALFAGKNYAGKSSLQEAVRMALVGESVRVGLKKDYALLVSEGEANGFAEISTDEGSYSVVLPGGKGVHSDNAALPYVLDAQRFASLPTDQRRAFLFGLMGVKLDGPSVKQRLLDKGCDAKKVEQTIPLLRAGFDAANKEAAAKAREAKASWRTTTSETYGSVKAASWVADKPSIDPKELDQAIADLEAVERELEADIQAFGDMMGRAYNAAEHNKRLPERRTKAGNIGRIREKLARDEAELVEWEAKVETLRGSLKSQDAIACPDCGVMLVMMNGALQHADPLAKGTEDDIAKLPEYERARDLMKSAVTNGKRDLVTAEAAEAAAKEIEATAVKEAPSDEEIAAKKARIEAIKESKRDLQLRISTKQEVLRIAEQADTKTKRAAELHLDVVAWETIADALAPDGIPGELLAEALTPLNERLAISSASAEWFAVQITKDMDVLAGSRPYALISESEKWRADAMIAEAISYLSGIKLLVLDRFDVLDLKGRSDLIFWLDALATDGDIDTALIFGTLKALPAQLPDAIAGFWIENGTTAQLQAAA